jgi:hypothetical protein
MARVVQGTIAIPDDQIEAYREALGMCIAVLRRPRWVSTSERMPYRTTRSIAQESAASSAVP